MGNCFSSDHSSQQLDPEVREPAVRQQSSRQPAGPSNPTATVQSTNTARPQIPGNALCSHCKAIPWDRLPSEEEPGYGHKPSLDALRQSAQSCSLCSFLLRATEDMKRIAPPEEGQRISSRSFIPLRFGDIRVEEVRYGRTFSACDDVDGSTADFYKVPPYFNRDYPRGPLRPFLFGSWWRFKGSPTPDQLVGLGVRLGTTPLIEDGEGNQRAWSQENRNVEEHVTFHGTFIRLRVVDGKDTYNRYVTPLTVCEILLWHESSQEGYERWKPTGDLLSIESTSSCTTAFLSTNALQKRVLFPQGFLTSAPMLRVQYSVW